MGHHGANPGHIPDNPGWVATLTLSDGRSITNGARNGRVNSSEIVNAEEFVVVFSCVMEILRGGYSVTLARSYSYRPNFPMVVVCARLEILNLRATVKHYACSK